ncbi:MAG: flagellar basal-body MS-ring/collar protein FliF [Clostridiaceae bacterium]|nr:flagellar basal-body MS-ring/collar protein FliF [Clostridiaceae bacterium]
MVKGKTSMDLTVSGIVGKITEYFKNMSARKRKIVISALVIIVVGAIVLTVLLNKKSYTILYRGMSSSEGADVIAALDELGAEYKVEDDGSVYVLEKDEARLKMKLASQGYPKSALSYDIFSSGSELMTTDYEKRQYLIFQLQDRLQDSIKTLNGVKNAIVTLNVADDSSFVLKSDKSESSASVVLELSGMNQLSKKQIQGIVALVAKSVSGLSAENVAVIDGDGVVLNDTEEEDGAGGTLLRMEMINSINKVYEEKITSLLEPVLGKGGLSVLANVVVDFSQKSVEETTYTPVVGENGIPSHYEYNNTSANGGKVAGGVTGTETNTGVPTYQESDGSVGSDKTASSSGTTDFLVNRMVQTIMDSGGRIEGMTVAVVINNHTLSDEAKEQYKEIIAFGTGISPDNVAVTNAEFLKGEKNTPENANGSQSLFNLIDLLGDKKWYAVAALGGVAILLIVAIIAMARKKKKKKDHWDTDISKIEMIKKSDEPQNKEELPGGIVLNETREQVLKKQIKEFSEGNPEIVAQLLRVWMKEGDAR